MPVGFFSSLLRAGVMYGATEVLMRGQWAKHHLKKYLSAIAFFIAAAVIEIFAVIVLLSSLFFQLADLFSFVKPALITGIIAFLLGLVSAMQGYRQIKKATRR